MDHQQKATKYETIWSAEDGDHEEFLSETDVDSSNEKTWHADEPRNKWAKPRGGLVYRIKRHRWIIDTSLLAVIVVLLVLLLLREPGLPEARQVGSDFTGSNKHCKSSLLIAKKERGQKNHRH